MRPPAVTTSGILLVDKPEELSSAAVVAKIKKKFSYAKVGHGGTLDPFATGLLVLLIGEATKIARFMLEGEKYYSFEAKIGSETDTGDFTGKTLEPSSTQLPSLQEWENSKHCFLGKTQQVPPQFSALKHQGRPLYEYARKGEVIPLAPREVEIFSLEIKSLHANTLCAELRCSGGTYIRSLAQDWARKTGTLAHLAKLRRLQSSAFSIAQAHTLTDLLALNPGECAPLLPIKAALSHLPEIFCNEEVGALVRKGRQECLSSLEPFPKELLLKENSYVLLSEKKNSHHLPLAILSWKDAYTIERVFA